MGIALTATLLVRLIAGPMCDKVGPRYTFAALLFAGAIPTFLAGTVKSAEGLMALRFFIGILGGSFVPCQVWSTGFFDKSIVGTANAITGGFGNSGGGITYFAMPAIFNSLVQRGLTPHTAWRVAFVVPGILIVSTAALMLLLTDDCPTGKWSEREQAAQANFRAHSVSEGAVVNVPGASSDSNTDVASNKDYKVGQDEKFGDHEAHIGQEQMEEAARGEVIEKPSLMQIVKVFSLQVLVCGACYFCSFGGELAFFMDGANGLNFAYVPHVFPANNGVVSGFTGACGNLGGIIFALVFRFNLTAKGAQDYPKAIWIMGAMIIGVNLVLAWVRPIPKGQIGGH